MEINSDTTRLWGMLRELEPKRQVQALRGGFRKAAQEVRKTAVRNLESSGLKGDVREVAKGIRAVVYRKVAGFKVTVGTKKQKRADYSGMSSREANKAKARRRLRIVPLWAEGGTSPRSTSRGFSRGSMPAFGFMERTDRDTEGYVGEIIRRNVAENIDKTARKYGSKTE